MANPTSKADLKEYFRTGDKPTETEFEELIDAFIHYGDNNAPITSSNNISSSATIIGNLGIFNSTISSGSMLVSGNIIPNVPHGEKTSSFSLGSPEAAWKDLYVSEDSIKFIKKSGSGASEELARITIDTGSGIMKFLGESDHKDLELRQTQFGESVTKGASINDGGGNFSNDVRFSMQDNRGSSNLIHGGAFVFRPEFTDLGYLGSDAVTNNFTFKGSGSAAFLLDADNNNKGKSKFKIYAHTALGGFGGTELFTVEETKKYKFHGTDGVVTIEGKVDGTVGSFTGGDVIIEEGVVVQPGTISQSLNIGTSTSPSINTMIGVGDDCYIKIADNVTVRINSLSKFIIQCLQPTITPDTNDGTITISDPNVLGSSDFTIFSNSTGNPFILHQNTSVPPNQIAYWSAGDIPGTYTTEDLENPVDSVGVQIGELVSTLFDGVKINGEIKVPSAPLATSHNVKLRVQEGAKLYIQPPTQITPVEGGTNITGVTTFANNLTVGSNTVTLSPEGHITASGNISSSGTITANTIATNTITGTALEATGLKSLKINASSQTGSLTVGPAARQIELRGGSTFTSTNPRILSSTGTIEVDDALQMNSHPIHFHEGATNSYIGVDVFTPDNLRIHANQDLYLVPDDNLIISSSTSAKTISHNDFDLRGELTASGNVSASGEIIASSLNLPNITSAAATDASHYSINGKRVEVRSQLQSGITADTGWTLELRNTSVTANSLIVANVIGGAGAIITGSVISANVVAANTASLNFYNIGAAIADDAAFTASIAIF
tara:strand:- start:667 stop:3009 length:2343 start_codon:yes stop_codon:yes gene_type:complete